MLLIMNQTEQILIWNAVLHILKDLQKFVKEKHLDVGFAYDGDADRCLCVDEKGNVS